MNQYVLARLAVSREGPQAYGRNGQELYIVCRYGEGVVTCTISENIPMIPSQTHFQLEETVSLILNVVPPLPQLQSEMSNSLDLWEALLQH